MNDLILGFGIGVVFGAYVWKMMGKDIDGFLKRFGKKGGSLGTRLGRAADMANAALEPAGRVLESVNGYSGNVGKSTCPHGFPLDRVCSICKPDEFKKLVAEGKKPRSLNEIRQGLTAECAAR